MLCKASNQNTVFIDVVRISLGLCVCRGGGGGGGGGGREGVLFFVVLLFINGWNFSTVL